MKKCEEGRIEEGKEKEECIDSVERREGGKNGLTEGWNNGGKDRRMHRGREVEQMDGGINR